MQEKSVKDCHFTFRKMLTYHHHVRRILETKTKSRLGKLNFTSHQSITLIPESIFYTRHHNLYGGVMMSANMH